MNEKKILNFLCEVVDLNVFALTNKRKFDTLMNLNKCVYFVCSCLNARIRSQPRPLHSCRKSWRSIKKDSEIWRSMVYTKNLHKKFESEYRYQSYKTLLTCTNRPFITGLFIKAERKKLGSNNLCRNSSKSGPALN